MLEVARRYYNGANTAHECGRTRTRHSLTETSIGTSPPPCPAPDSAIPTLLDRVGQTQRAQRTALIDAAGRSSYGDLVGEAGEWRRRIVREAVRPSRHGFPAPGQEGPGLGHGSGGSLRGERIALLVPPGRRHVAVQLGIWAGGGIAVPLAVSHPLRELEHVLDDAAPALVVTDPAHPLARPFAASARARRAAVLELPASARPAGPPDRPATQPPATTPAPPRPGPALIIYTSGTTGRPKGVLTTHRNLAAQITALTTAWEWTADDHILHTLPLHHIHGVVNALACALWSGATCEFGDGAPASTWDRFAAGGITLFMSVPTVYHRLIRAWDAASADVRRRWSQGAARLRLMVSGSAALPVSTLERWREITGHTLLERYGMTEIGMALSNPLHGERRPGHVGRPLPGAEVRIVGDDGRTVAPGAQGEIEVRGPQVFREYWGRPAETAAAFRSGWFRTGDEAVEAGGGQVRILGRRSVDIVKTGGYKVSALEVEELYRTHPAVRDMAVVGVPHPEWGERLQAAWVPAGRHAEAATADQAVGSANLRPVGRDARGTRREPADGGAREAIDLRAWGKERLAPYKVPHVFLAVGQLPRNAMGKVQKAAVRRMFEAARDVGDGEDVGAPTPASSQVLS